MKGTVCKDQNERTNETRQIQMEVFNPLYLLFSSWLDRLHSPVQIQK